MPIHSVIDVPHTKANCAYIVTAHNTVQYL